MNTREKWTDKLVDEFTACFQQPERAPFPDGKRYRHYLHCPEYVPTRGKLMSVRLSRTTAKFIRDYADEPKRKVTYHVEPVAGHPFKHRRNLEWKRWKDIIESKSLSLFFAGATAWNQAGAYLTTGKEWRCDDIESLLFEELICGGDHSFLNAKRMEYAAGTKRRDATKLAKKYGYSETAYDEAINKRTDGNRQTPIRTDRGGDAGKIRGLDNLNYQKRLTAEPIVYRRGHYTKPRPYHPHRIPNGSADWFMELASQAGKFQTRAFYQKYVYTQPYVPIPREHLFLITEKRPEYERVTVTNYEKLDRTPPKTHAYDLLPI